VGNTSHCFLRQGTGIGVVVAQQPKQCGSLSIP
jgi:hypothetical protein